MKKLNLFLDQEVANFSVLFTKLHNFHWYVNGPEFFRLHELFEKYYDEVNEFYDEFAERLLTIGGNPSTSLKKYLELTTLKEVDKELTPHEMVQMLYDDFMQIVKELHGGIKLAQELADEVTADMFISTSSTLEKHAWMLRAYLK